MAKNWDSALYDGKHNFVTKYGEDLIGLLAPAKDEKILDLGCGTGDLTAMIAQSGAHVIGVDSSPEMIDRSKEKHPELDFRLMDALELHFDTSFDAVFSNAVLHWIKQPEKALGQIYSVLVPGGRFVAEFGGKDNVRRIIDAVIGEIRGMGYSYDDASFPWYYPSIGEYATLMEQAGFTVAHALYFDRPTKLSDPQSGLRDWITMFAGSFLTGLSDAEKAQLFENVQDKLEGTNRSENTWIADYKRIRVLGYK